MNSTFFKILLILIIGLLLGYYAFAIGIVIIKAFIGLALLLILVFGITIGYYIAKKKNSENQ